MTRFLQIILALLLIVLTVMGWYIVTPGYTIRQMTSAALNDEEEVLRSYVDFDALRGSVREHVSAQASAEIQHGSDRMRSLGIAMSMPMLDRMVEGLVSIQQIDNVFSSDEVRDGVIVRDSLSQFRLIAQGRPQLVFQRYGIGWKLTGVRQFQGASLSGAEDGSSPNAGTQAPVAEPEPQAVPTAELAEVATPSPAELSREEVDRMIAASPQREVAGQWFQCLREGMLFVGVIDQSHSRDSPASEYAEAGFVACAEQESQLTGMLVREYGYDLGNATIRTIKAIWRESVETAVARRREQTQQPAQSTQ